MMNLYCPDYLIISLTVMDYFSVYPIVRLSVSESIHKSVLFKLLNFCTVVRKALDGYIIQVATLELIFRRRRLKSLYCFDFMIHKS